VRVVIDTNVFVSSFFNSKGAPKGVIDLWKTGKIILCVSEEILGEYMEVLARFGLYGEPELEKLLGLFKNKENSIFILSTPCFHVIEADPDDNKFIECAVAAKAYYIISGDKHLTRLEEFNDIKIISPADFLYLFRGG